MAGLWFKPKLVPISYWYVLVENFESSSGEFYATVREALENREVPNLEIRDVEFPEGGSFSARRQYLRLRRERLVFDVCSSSFGTSWFFSCRFGEVPLKLGFWRGLLLFLLVVQPLGLFILVFGYTWGVLAFLLNVAGLLFLLGSVLRMGLYGVDSFLIKVPLLGAFYELHLRRETYYRDDTRRMYCETVDRAVRSIVLDTVGTDRVQEIEFKQEAPVPVYGFWGRLRESMKAVWQVMKRG